MKVGVSNKAARPAEWWQAWCERSIVVRLGTSSPQFFMATSKRRGSSAGLSSPTMVAVPVRELRIGGNLKRPGRVRGRPCARCRSPQYQRPRRGGGAGGGERGERRIGGEVWEENVGRGWSLSGLLEVCPERARFTLNYGPQRGVFDRRLHFAKFFPEPRFGGRQSQFSGRWPIHTRRRRPAARADH